MASQFAYEGSTTVTRKVLLALAAALIALAVVTVLLVRATSTVNPGTAVPPLYLGLDSYAHWDKLSYLEIGDRIGSQTTADPGGSNQVMDLHGTLLDEVGPGVATILRFQKTFGSPWGLIVDGKSTVINPSDLGEMKPAGSPSSQFPYPLSLNEDQSHGSSIIATAVPFADELKVTAGSANGNFYSMYRKLPLGAALPAYGDPAATSEAVALLRAAGTDIAPAGIPSLSGTATLGAANNPVALATITGGPYQIRAIKIRVPLSKAVDLGNDILRIYWDGETSPSVDAPIKFLAGDGAGVYSPSGRQLVQGLLANITSDGKTYMSFNLYYPMPFASSARIVIAATGASAGLAGINWSVRYQAFSDPKTWWAPFHANYVSIPKPTPGQNMTFLDYHGSGKLVGTVVNFGSVGETLEGNPYFYLDGSQTPQFAGTGTEEWGFGGNYWDNGQQVSLAMAGLPSATNNASATNNPVGANVDGAAEYRFLIADSIPFNNQIVVQWEHGGTDDSTQPYRATMLWYGTPAQTAVLSDELQPASGASAAAHSFKAPGSSAFTLRAAYEYLPYAPLTTGAVVQTTGTATFTMKVSSGNVGAFVRRTFDSCIASQRATVWVDGTFAGTWYNPGASPGTGYDGHDRCWRDDDFVLPPGLTQGKSSVTIRLTAATASTDWTASDYKLYSFVPVAAGSGAGSALPAPAGGGSPYEGPLPPLVLAADVRESLDPGY
jgi:Protein of unknown function (DUF2961)